MKRYVHLLNDNEIGEINPYVSIAQSMVWSVGLEKSLQREFSFPLKFAVMLRNKLWTQPDLGQNRLYRSPVVLTWMQSLMSPGLFLT